MTSVDVGSRFVEVQVRDRVLYVVVNRPERRNAFTQDMYRGLKRAAIHADGDPEIDAICLTGTGEWFGAGGDMAGNAEDAEGLAHEWDHTDHFPFRHFESCRKIIVSKVNGVCQAGGLNLVMYSDVSVASDRATFRVPELLRGLPDPYMAARLADLVGLGKARYLYFTAAGFDAHEAEAMGLIGKVVVHDDLDEHVEWVLEQVRLTGPNARAAVKEDLNRDLRRPDLAMWKRTIPSPEMREGMAAFLEKRRPEWPR